MNEQSEIKESLDFQYECLKSVMKKYGMTHKKLSNNLVGFSIYLIEALSRTEEGQHAIDFVVERYFDDNDKITLQFLAECKIKILELENSAVGRILLDENR